MKSPAERRKHIRINKEQWKIQSQLEEIENLRYQPTQHNNNRNFQVKAIYIFPFPFQDFVSKWSKAKGNLKAPRPNIDRGVKQQKGTSPIKVRHLMLNTIIRHVELKTYEPHVLNYYNQVFLKCVGRRN